MKKKLEKQLDKYQSELQTVENNLNLNLTTKERLIGAIVATKELLKDFDEKPKK